VEAADVSRPYCTNTDDDLVCPGCGETGTVEVRAEEYYRDGDTVEAYCSSCDRDLEVMASVEIVFSGAEVIGDEEEDDMGQRQEFAVHMLNEGGKEKAQAIARDFGHLLDNLESVIGSAPSREMSIVKTKLEEACFFAKKAMASQAGNQQG
jgi:hypothetical protein